MDEQDLTRNLSTTTQQLIQIHPLLPEQIQSNSKKIKLFKKSNQITLKKRKKISTNLQYTPIYPQDQHRTTLFNTLNQIINEPQKPIPISLTIISKICKDLVISDSTLALDLYTHLQKNLKSKANQFKNELLRDILIQDSLSLPNSDKSLLDQISSLHESSYKIWLSKLHSIWQSWSNLSALALNILLPIDLHCRLSSPDYLTIRELSLAIFRNDVIGKPWNPIWNSISLAIFHQIALLRSGKKDSLDLIQSVIEMIYKIYSSEHIYNLIGSSFQQVTESFFADQGKQFASQIQAGFLKLDGPEGYVNMIRQKMESETALYRAIFQTPRPGLNRRLWNSTRKSISNHLILVHLETILEFGFTGLLNRRSEPESVACLGEFYKLIQLHGGDQALQQLRTSFSNWIKQTGSHCVKEIDGSRKEKIQHDATMVVRLCDLKLSLDYLATVCFSQDSLMVLQIQLAFESFLNQRGSKVAELLAHSCHQVMLCASPTWSPTTPDNLFNKILSIFRLAPAKDIFSKRFQTYLAFRLSTFHDPWRIHIEERLIHKITLECGSRFTQEWVVMLQDVEISRKLCEEYQIKRREGVEESENKEKMKSSSPFSSEGDKIELRVLVSTNGIWPISNNCKNIILPIEIKSQMNKFVNFYTSKPQFSSRTLSWVHNRGQFVLGVNFSNINQQQLPSTTTSTPMTPLTSTPSGNQSLQKDFKVHTFVALILLLFDDLGDQSIHFRSIVQKTGIEEKYVMESLRYLVYGSPNLLLRHAESTREAASKQVITSHDRFSFNSNLSFSNLNDQLGEPLEIKLNRLADYESPLLLGREVCEMMTPNKNKEDQQAVRSIENETLIEVTIVSIMKKIFSSSSSQYTSIHPPPPPPNQLKSVTLKFDEIHQKLKLLLNHRIGIDHLLPHAVKLSLQNLVSKEYLIRVGQDEFQYFP